MHEFFAIVERAGIEHQHLADLMGVHKSTFSRVKAGKRRLNDDFMCQAEHALREIGIRRIDGTPYTKSDLFFAPKETDITKMAMSVTEAAD